MDFNLEEFLEEQPEATDPRVEEEDDDDGEEEPETTQPRPRTKVEGERRKRGRPRVNPRDQSATERRRTQIRLAQRAYRQRKETTISGLKRRVQGLERTVQQMNQGLLEFQELAFTSGIQTWSPQLAARLQSTAEDFARMSQEALPQGEEEGGPPEAQEPQEQEQRQQQQQQWGQMYQQSQLWNPETYDQPFQQYPNMFCAQFPDLPHPEPTTLPLTYPMTYAHHETSFTRRLMRMGVERSIRKIEASDGDRPPPFFKLSGCFVTKEDALACFRCLLSRDPSQTLEYLECPERHLGGSGLHYPRRGIDASGPAPEGWDQPHQIGPLPLPSKGAMNPEVAGMCLDDMVSALGFEGEWFDSNDVEEYLRERGLDLNAGSRVVEFREPLTESGMSQESEGQALFEEGVWDFLAANDSSDPSSLPNALLPMTSATTVSTASPPMSPRSKNAFFSGWPTDTGHAASTTGQLPLWPPDPSTVDAQASSEPEPKPKRFIDVDKFIEGILEDSACLGRGAGFRRYNVDRVLEMATMVVDQDLRLRLMDMVDVLVEAEGEEEEDNDDNKEVAGEDGNIDGGDWLSSILFPSFGDSGDE